MTLLGKFGLRDEKESIVNAFTGGRTTSTKVMSDKEAVALIAHLQSLDTDVASAEKMRNKILYYGHEMNWRLPGTERIDMQRVNNWCIKFGYLKKPLDAHTQKELPQLLSQFEQVYKSYLKNK